MAGVKTTPQQAADNWNTGFSGAATKYKAGIEAVTVAPGQLAAAASDLWLQNTQAAKARYTANVAAVPLAAWKTAAADIGSMNLASGAKKGQPKMQSFMGKFLPALDSIVGSLPARGSYENNKARAIAYMDNLHAQKGNF